jgi:uncharacterized FAD-dependent dehydrogenase
MMEIFEIDREQVNQLETENNLRMNNVFVSPIHICERALKVIIAVIEKHLIEFESRPLDVGFAVGHGRDIMKVLISEIEEKRSDAQLKRSHRSLQRKRLKYGTSAL